MDSQRQAPSIADIWAEPAAMPAAHRQRVVVRNLLISLRPREWTKNLIVFAGVVFGHRLLEPEAVGHAVGAFVTFGALSGVVYVVNDVMDREGDRRHPLKCRRPIASGAVSVSVALGVA